MVKRIFFIMALTVTVLGHSQKITVTESGDALVTSIYETDPSDIVSGWKSLMKKYDAKVDAGRDKIVAKGAVIKSMSGGAFDVTATLEKIKNGEVKFVVIFDPIASASTTTPEKSAYMSGGKSIVHDFSYKCSSDAISDMVKDCQKAYDKLVKQRDAIVKTNTGLADDIEGYKKKITDAERDIKMNKDKIDAKNKQMEAQKKVVDGTMERQKSLN